jgi:hypothetical protein
MAENRKYEVTTDGGELPLPPPPPPAMGHEASTPKDMLMHQLPKNNTYVKAMTQSMKCWFLVVKDYHLIFKVYRDIAGSAAVLRL